MLVAKKDRSIPDILSVSPRDSLAAIRDDLNLLDCIIQSTGKENYSIEFGEIISNTTKLYCCRRFSENLST